MEKVKGNSPLPQAKDETIARLHSALACVSLMQFGHGWLAAQARKASS
ncbi:MAG: hypothetical protein M3R45_15430 [Pseudomonadota bacterium]|nr:hypothetical protein [Pseudomonadota bacterium]